MTFDAKTYTIALKSKFASDPAALDALLAQLASGDVPPSPAEMTAVGLSQADLGAMRTYLASQSYGAIGAGPMTSAMPAPMMMSAVPGAGAPVPAPAAAATPASTVLLKPASGSAAAAPAWVHALSTASIAADMIAADVNGTVTYAGLETVLADLDATLTSSKTALTTGEFADLKTIAANLNNGMTTSGYLAQMMQDVAGGAAANATWTGGAAASTALGNLSVGSSAGKLSELIGKWFLGTDLPSSTVKMTGDAAFSVSYTASAKPLFGSAGPTMADVNQGYLGDCYLLSSLAEVASQNAGLISSMFTANGNGSYGVRFYVGGVADYVTVNSALADNGNVFNFGADIWASLAEKAYAQLQAGGVATGNPGINAGNSFSTIGNGGAPEYALEEITGASAITDFFASGSSWSSYVYNASLTSSRFGGASTTASVQNSLLADLSQGDDVVLSSNTNGKDSAGRSTLIADHAMSIYGFDRATSLFEIRNPWGAESGQTWDTTFEVSLATLLSDGDTITADNAGHGVAPVLSPPTVANQTAAQTWLLGQAVNFALSATTFADPRGEAMTYRATLATGAALPSWLTFNASTRTFSGVVPNSASGLAIQVTATDADGLSASETFAVATTARAPILAAQTANQTWAVGKAFTLAIPAGAFVDPQGETLSYSAAGGGNGALPSWLKFNAATDTFSGVTPANAASFQVKVTATDTSGLSASELITLTVSPTLAHGSSVGAVAGVYAPLDLSRFGAGAGGRGEAAGGFTSGALAGGAGNWVSGFAGGSHGDLDSGVGARGQATGFGADFLSGFDFTAAGAATHRTLGLA